MNASNLPRRVMACVTIAMLAGCGGGGQQSAAPMLPRAAHRTSSASYQQLYQFHRQWGGTHATGGLVNVNGTLYGTTARGGASGNGTVYSMTTGGAHKVLYRFRGGSDGSDPHSQLLDVKDTLYGTTAYGGSANAGTVYSVTTSGAEKVLYAFKGGSDGAVPMAGLASINGVLYGTTGIGGSCALSIGCGVVYSITPSGDEKVLYAFKGGSDGESPLSSLVNVNGTLYGTTYEGGQSGPDCSQAFLCGTVFGVSTGGAEKVIHRFASGADGAEPEAGLIDVNGVLYGTTTSGGTVGSCFQYNGNCGTIYSITTGGAESVLYTFAGGTDGWSPSTLLTNVNGTLYGTTYSGGFKDKCCHIYGLGTVYALTP